MWELNVADLNPTAVTDRLTGKDAHGKSSRELIINAAIRLFCRDGIGATGIDTVVREAGVARMTVYNKFGSKERLVTAALEHESATWRAWFFGKLDQLDASPREKLLAVFDVLAEWFERDDYFGCALMNAVLESRHSNDTLIAVTIAHKKPVLAILQDLGAAANAPDPARFAQLMDLIMNGAIVNAVFAGNAQPAIDAKLIAAALFENLLP